MVFHNLSQFAPPEILFNWWLRYRKRDRCRGSGKRPHVNIKPSPCMCMHMKGKAVSYIDGLNTKTKHAYKGSRSPI
ncbi:hypothetical protein BABINDRAFT_104759 [Babjeviella inositovora NRRL Y-12698]|uniref:Uncharacterized protein n=1 Tax=Babjeviella inositovora NRRL Y-12698 TaxID=984486 RepID=A0A1E3QJ47_9ASCO|nr:uncharacterized protein BABINDRAFT_104759 [Babjeviella inositovora NRRL Y-12698]ODQ77092.1 hypothetical protein BABINDRAFT_104759 [Babjeviella inositovora NRRL Y-12698]